MRPIVLPLPGNDALAAHLSRALEGQRGRVEMHRFPDEEAHLRTASTVSGRPVVIAAALDHVDDVLLPLILLSASARELGATSVGLVAPYLPYLRQDRGFEAGEEPSARRFAALMSDTVDWLVTVDPHLHHLPSLLKAYRIPAESIAVTSRVSRWISEHVLDPILVGFDEASRPWLEPIAAECGVPAVTLRKRRVGNQLEVELPEMSPFRKRTPVLIDDIISTGRTMIEATRALIRSGAGKPDCVAVHGIFAAGAYGSLLAAGARRIVTCNTVRHASNRIEVHDLLAAAAVRVLSGVTNAWAALHVISNGV
jgi:ribose-phosphate pyrophosphokinase